MQEIDGRVQFLIYLNSQFRYRQAESSTCKQIQKSNIKAEGSTGRSDRGKQILVQVCRKQDRR